LFFSVGYWTVSVLYVLLAAILALLPGSGGVRWAVGRYSLRMVQLMKLCGIQPEVRGRERLPPPPFILAPKHSSWGDGFLMYIQFKDVAFVTGDHLRKFPLLPKVLDKLGAIVVNNCGGHEARKELAASFAIAAEQKRIVLIYPEGNLARVGEKHRYRAGVWHMQEASGWPVVPVATSLGMRWQQEDYKKYPGPAVIEFFDPIPPGLGKDEMLARLEEVNETNSNRLIEEGRAWDREHGIVRPAPPAPAPATESGMTSAYDFHFDKIAGGDLPLSAFKGKVVLVVNVASKCGLTPQYEGLVKLYEDKKDKGLIILGVPSNQFMGQEPGSNEEIQTFCSTTYGVDFPLTGKVDVKDADAHPFYKWMEQELGGEAKPKWNFHKLLVGKKGEPIATFDPTVKPDDPVLLQAIDNALKE
jgi:1-acyl-sn-glycerol-3-phosphate acyltransferase